MYIYISILFLYFYYRQPQTSSTQSISKKNASEFFKNIRGKIDTAQCEAKCQKCRDFEQLFKEKSEENEDLKKQLNFNESALQSMENKYRQYKTKYKKVKNELKNVKKTEPEDTVKFGSILIEKSKLSLCRVNDFSKYVGDLLDICFGRDTLSQSVLRCSSNTRSNKTQILDSLVINDIIMHVMQIFSGISVGKVKGAIRQKLNTCHKAQQKIKNVKK